MSRALPCGKFCLSETKAKAVVLYAAYDRHNTRRQERSYYFCAGCKAWHTTSQ